MRGFAWSWTILCLQAASSAAVIAGPAGGKAQSLWSLEPLGAPVVPAVRDASWARTPIDRFVLSKLEDAGVEPAAPAAKAALLRRVTLDLIGLLPTPEETAAFQADDSPDAYEKVVDRLLASPHHGERWARHWLDLARFAESEGFKSDETRPNAWRYRDYVIRALNADKPYDRFIEEQIAGDELWPEDFEARIATAFQRHYADESNARNLLQRRQEILNDITDTVGQVVLGLTFGCARCHDHKYDPISQADYYSLQAFFANVRAWDDFPLGSPDEQRRYREKLATWEERTAPIRAEMASIEEPKRREIANDNFVKFPPEIQEAIRKPAAARTPIEWLMYYKAEPYMNPERGAVVGGLAAEAKKRWKALEQDLAKYQDLNPGEIPVGTGMVDAGPEAPKTFVLAGGVYDAPKEEVEPAYPSAVLGPKVPPGKALISRPGRLESTGRRAALARWLADARNPLPPRVMANRLWHYHFGRGIAGTPSDLGVMGERPTHRELLDWLATELVRDGWSLKRLHRAIVTSSVYRQASVRQGTLAADADAVSAVTVRLFARFPPRRLEGETLRDTVLQAAGLLDLAIGGPSVYPELPDGMGPGGYTRWDSKEDGSGRTRRSVYVFVKRNLRYPFFELFDMPDTHESCGRRNLTITAPQALMMLNDKLVIAWAKAFAGRVARHAGSARPAQIAEAYRICFSREPEPNESAEAVEFLARQETILGDADAALADFCHALLNSSEFASRS